MSTLPEAIRRTQQTHWLLSKIAYRHEMRVQYDSPIIYRHCLVHFTAMTILWRYLIHHMDGPRCAKLENKYRGCHRQTFPVAPLAVQLEFKVVYCPEIKYQDTDAFSRRPITSVHHKNWICPQHMLVVSPEQGYEIINRNNWHHWWLRRYWL